MGGGGGAQRPVRRGNEPKKTGARSARARTRGQNPLVENIFIKNETLIRSFQITEKLVTSSKKDHSKQINSEAVQTLMKYCFEKKWG